MRLKLKEQSFNYKECTKEFTDCLTLVKGDDALTPALVDLNFLSTEKDFRRFILVGTCIEIIWFARTSKFLSKTIAI